MLISQINENIKIEYKNSNCFNINNLPDDIFIHIFKFLKDDIVSITFTCKLYNELVIRNKFLKCAFIKQILEARLIVPYKILDQDLKFEPEIYKECIF